MKTLLESDIEFVCDIKAPCFQSLLPEEAELIRNSKTQVLFHKGENLSKQGAFASYVLFIVDGLVKQYVEGSAQKNYNLRLVKTGDFIGLSAVFNKQTFNYSTVAVRQTKAFLIEKEAFENLIKNNGQFAYSIIKRYSMQDNALYEAIRSLTNKQMNGRLADTLLYLSSDEFKGEEVFVNLSRKDIADFVGISTESAVKLLKTFEKEGIVKLEEKDIRILNRDILEDISRRG